MKLIIIYTLLFLIFISGGLNAQNWIRHQESNGIVNLSTSTAYIRGVDNSDPGINGITYSATGNQVISFDWSYLSHDEDAFYDQLYYTINGNRTNLMGPGGGIFGNGNLVVSLVAGDVFFVGIDNSFDGCCGYADVSISNLTPIYSITSLTITPPLATLTSNCSGVPSTPTTFGVSGSNLSSTITISAPTGFEISTVSNTSFVSSLSLTPNNANTVSSTLYIRLTSSATNSVSGTITALSTSGGSSVSSTTTVSSTTVAPPTLNSSSYTLCSQASYPISLTIDPNSFPRTNGWSTSSANISVNNYGYVTAGTTIGSYTVSYTDACSQTASATIVVNSSDNSITPVTDGQSSYKINNTSPIPQGPTASLYMGYNGYDYSSSTKPTNPGFYRANNVDLTNKTAGCPYPFLIFRCTTCPN